MRPPGLLVVIAVAAIEIYDDGGHASSSSLMNKFQKKDWWGSSGLKPLVRKQLSEEPRKGLYRKLSRYPQFTTLRIPEETQSLPIEASIIGRRRNARTKIEGIKLGYETTNPNDDHAVKLRALFPSLICPSDIIKLHGKCKKYQHLTLTSIMMTIHSFLDFKD